jgi:hypothetical protein
MMRSSVTLAGVLSLFCFDLCAAPVQRTLELRLTIDATQDWRNDPQWGMASSQQSYSLASQLRSDGRLYTQNLLDPDPPRRMQIKMDWYLYQGLLELKAENGCCCSLKTDQLCSRRIDQG